MWMFVANLAVLAGTYIYHRYNDKQPKYERTLTQPRTEEGSPVPLVFGRERVRRPIIAFTSPVYIDFFTDISPHRYRMDMFIVLGIPFENGTNRVHRMWTDEYELPMLAAGSTFNDSPIAVSGPYGGAAVKALEDLTGSDDSYIGGANHEYAAVDGREVILMDPSGVGSDETGRLTYGCVQFHNGAITQSLITQGTWAHRSMASYYMEQYGLIVPEEIPSYRGMMSVFLFDLRVGATNGAHWSTGNRPQLESYSFEVSSYPTTPLYAFAPAIGDDANPADVLYALFVDKLGKLGLDASKIDLPTFMACAVTLYLEGNGYSRIVEEFTNADDVIDEICRQIDGLWYVDPTTDTVKLKLIRADYDPRTIPGINVDNCEALTDFAAGGRTGSVSKVRVIFMSRLATLTTGGEYKEGSAVAHSLSNAAGQVGSAREVVLNYPGVHTQALADAIATRELAARSRPVAKMRAVVDRSFWRTNPGDAVSVSWPEYNISGMVCRVARVNRGSADSNSVTLDLIQDFFYVHRSSPATEGVTGAFPTSAAIE